MDPYPNIRELERLSNITWLDLAELEPRLEELLWEARRACAACRCWSDMDRVFAPIRAWLSAFVGFAGQNHRHPVLGSPDAYNVAYWKLYDAVAVLLPVWAGSAEKAPEKQREETVAKTCPAEAAAAPRDVEFVPGLLS